MEDNVFIQVKSGSVYPKSFKVNKNIIKLGRNKSSDIVIDDKKASRNHARIISGGGIYKIEDLNSRNGTYVNGLKIKGKKVLNYGDSIKIGDNEFLLSTLKQDKKTIQNNKPLLIAVILIVLVIPSVAIPTYMFTGPDRIRSYDSYDVTEEIAPLEEYEDSGDEYNNDQQSIDEVLDELQSNIKETRNIDFAQFNSPQDFLNIENYKGVLDSIIYKWDDLLYSIEGLPDFPGKGDILYSVRSVYSSLDQISMFLDDYNLIHLKNAVTDLYNALDNLDSLLTGLL